MSIRVKPILIFTVVLFTILASSKRCQNGQIWIHKCVSCSNIKNTETPQTNFAPLPDNQCPCKQGFLWSRVLSECIAFTSPIKQSRLLLDGEKIVVNAQVTCNTTSQYLNPGLNKCVCNQTKKYAAVNNSCIFCPQAAFSNGFANELGCICRNGLSWNSTIGQCVCPSRWVFIGDTCKACASATFPSGVTVTDCNSCSRSKGFANQKLGCFLCVSQNGANTTITNGSCTCTGKGQVWKPLKGLCSCDWTQFYVTVVNSTGGFSCRKCPYIMSSNASACPCGISFLKHDSINQICTDVSNDPNSNFTNLNSFDNILCKDGYKIDYKKYPYKCVAGYNASAGFYSSSTQSYAACSTAQNQAGCVSCDSSAGYLLITDTNQCLLCSTVTGATGDASPTGCACQTGKQWNSITLTCDTATCAAGTIYQPNSKLCICDPIKSITIASKCIPCSSISQSNGYAANKTSCSCIAPLFWVGNATGGSCTNTTCNLATQIILSNRSCYTCPNKDNGAGASNGTACKCNANYIWSPKTTGGSCVCNLTIAYSTGTNCVLCSLDKNSNGTGNGKGACNCVNLFNWTVSGTTGSCKPCNAQPKMVSLSNGSCFTCGTSGTFTATKVTNNLNNSCSCTARNLIWNSGGYCDCGSSSAMIITGNSFVCFSCNNANAFTSAKIDTYNCSCLSTKLKWNATKKACGCSDPSSVVTGSGSAASCFACVIGGYIIGTSADQKTCLCVKNLVWLSSSLSCGCSDSTKIIISGSGATVQCVSCSTLKYSKTKINSTACSCLGSELVFSSSTGYCDCPTGSIILPNFTCFACPSGSSVLTPYECICASGFIWNYTSRSCVQCGSAILNSVSTGGTSLACVCQSSFTWDVMTQTCISSTACPRTAASCMKCPSGTASALKAANARNLKGGSSIQALLNGTFTNYNQIKAYQCSCVSGYAWDSLRLRCYSTGLQ